MFQTLSLGVKPYAKVIHIGKSHKPTRRPKLAKEYVFPSHGLTAENKARAHNTVHISERGWCGNQRRILASQFRVLSDRNALRNPPRQHVPTVIKHFELRYCKYSSPKIKMKYMKKIFFLLSILTLCGCSKIEDDTDSICTSDCTILQGKFITMNNEGIPGVKVSIQYQHGGGLLPYYARKIAETVTDENGDFYKEFYIKNNELGDSAEGCFSIDFDITSLDSNKYILTEYLYDNICQINTRDTVLGNTYYLPKRTHIKVNLNNFIPIQEDDNFEVRTLYPCGPDIGYNEFLDTKYQTGSSGYNTFSAVGKNTQLNVFVAENELNIIRIFRRKNGNNTHEDFPLFVPSNNDIELSYDY